MKGVTLKQLRYFDALARHGHFGRAAEASSISQPALSMQIKDLETALGTELFERGARGVQLTSFGEKVRARVQGILRAVDELGELARSSGEALSGPFKLGVIPTIAPYILPAVLMLICMIVSFSIGSSFGTYAVVFPIALPLAYAISPDPLFFTLNFGAIMGGAVFGDQCSPISDTTVLSSIASGCDHIEHVRTQMPYAMVVGAVAIGIGTIPGGYGLSPWISLPIGAAVLVAFLRFFGRKADESVH